MSSKVVFGCQVLGILLLVGCGKQEPVQDQNHIGLRAGTLSRQESKFSRADLQSLLQKSKPAPQEVLQATAKKIQPNVVKFLKQVEESVPTLTDEKATDEAKKKEDEKIGKCVQAIADDFGPLYELMGLKDGDYQVVTRIKEDSLQFAVIQDDKPLGLVIVDLKFDKDGSYIGLSLKASKFKPKDD